MKPGSARQATEGETLSGNLSTITSKLGSPQFSKSMIMLVSVCLVAQMQIAVVEFPAPNKRSCPSARYMAGCKRPHGNLGDSVCSTSRDTASHTDEGRDPFSGWTNHQLATFYNCGRRDREVVAAKGVSYPTLSNSTGLAGKFPGLWSRAPLSAGCRYVALSREGVSGPRRHIVKHFH